MSANFIEAFEAARQHARAEFPKESCGVIVNDRYIACENLAKPASEHIPDDESCGCQLCSFRISANVMIEHGDDLQMIIHSHPNGPLFPSLIDTKSQISTGVAWGLIALDDSRCNQPLVWGGDTPLSPILGREFMHFTSDCYTLIMDTFALGKDALAAQDIEGWPFDPIILPDFPRADGWWGGEDDFYNTKPFEIGFVEIPAESAKPGDVFLMSIRSEKMNHGGVLLTNGLLMHHLPARLSRREPAGIWSRQVKRWLRYVGEGSNHA